MGFFPSSSSSSMENLMGCFSPSMENKQMARFPPSSMERNNEMERPSGLIDGCVFLPSVDALCRYHSKITENPKAFYHPLVRMADVYSEPPDQLTGRYWADVEGKQEWFFFTKIALQRADNGGKKTWASRSVGLASKWRGSQVKEMKNRDDKVVGTKRTFEYVVKAQGSKDFEKTQWLMEEYRFTTDSDQLQPWVICKIYTSPRAQQRHPLAECSATLNKGVIEADDCVSVVDDEITPSVPAKRRRIETVEVEDSTLCNPSFVPARSEVVNYQAIGSSQTTDEHEDVLDLLDFDFDDVDRYLDDLDQFL